MGFGSEIIEKISPGYALKRKISEQKLKTLKQISNSGYSEGGANRQKNALKGFLGKTEGAFEDIDKNLHDLRQFSRLLYMTSPIATSAIKSNRTNVIGQGLTMKSRIDFNFLGLSHEEADLWERNAEREFSLWADSKFCDIRGIDNFYELQQLALMGWLLNGDCFALIKNVEKTPYMPYGLRLHLIEADRICTPNSNGKSNLSTKLPSGNMVYNGVELDKHCQVVAYHVCSIYPSSSGEKEYVRVEAFGKRTGMSNIVHVMESERAEQLRGVPYLSIVIESIKQLTRYSEAELMAAVINGYFTLFIETENGDEIDFEGIATDDSQNDSGNYQLGAGIVNVLRKGEKVNPVDPKRPNINFDGFVTSMSKYIGAALEIPYEVLLKSFNSSYSASRAALMEAWKAYRMRRSWFANDFCQPIYEIWLSEAVASGRINAPGFFNNPLVRKAYCQAEWNGPAAGQIDPVKEVDAAIKRIESGLSTREKETKELTGGDFDRNIEGLKLEYEKMRSILLSESQ